MSRKHGLGIRKHPKLLATASSLAISAAALSANPAWAGAYTASDEASLKTAIANANADADANATITLAADITISDPATLLSATKPITLNNGGFDLTGATLNSSSGVTLIGSGQVQLAGSSTTGVISATGPRIAVTGQGTSVSAQGAAIGQNGGVGAELWVTNGGQFTSTANMSVQGAPSVVTVDGTGSTLTTAGATIGVNTGGVATLNVENGGTFRSTVGLLVGGPSGTGAANIIGQGSLVEVANNLTMATSSGASATLNINQGGVLRSASANIGAPFVATSTPSAIVSGPGSLWAVSGNFNAAVSALSVLDGGAVTAGASVLGGVGSVARSTLLVSGSGSTFAVTGAMSVGTVLAGTNVTVADGGLLSVGGAFTLGQAASYTGVLNIGGAEGQAAAAAGSVAAPTVTFGPGVGRINFNHTDSNYDFGAAISGAGAIKQVAGVTRLTGASSGFTGSTTVSGGELRVDGSLGTAASTVTVNGGTLSGAGTIGGAVTVNAGGAFAPTPGAGTLTINGALALNGGVQTVTGSSSVGGGVTLVGSTLNLQSGAELATSGAFIARGVGAVGVSGPGSALVANAVSIGNTDGSQITFLVDSAGEVQTSLLMIAASDITPEAHVTVSGAGSLVTAADVEIANNVGGNVGSLTLADSGRLNSAGATIGFDFGNATPTQVAVSDGALWTVTGNMRFRTGEMAITNGGAVAASSLNVGANGGLADLKISGGGSSLTAGVLNIGVGPGASVVTLSDGAGLSVTGPMSLALNSAGSGVLNVGGAEGQAAAGAGALSAATLSFGPGAGRLNFNHTSTNYSLATQLIGQGAINQVAGVTHLTGDSSTFSGATTVSGGALHVDGTLGGVTSTVAVNTGGVLGGAGTVGGDVTVNAGGVLAPGNSPGTLTIAGDLTLNSGAILNMEFGAANAPGAPLNDLIVVGGALTLDGTINVSQSAGGVFGNGVYRIIDYTGALTDNGLDVGTLPRGSATVQTSIEMMALFVRFWLTTTPALPEGAQAAAQAKGKERFEGFVEALGRRLARGASFAREVSDDVSGGPTP